jgi:hypothetical protein
MPAVASFLIETEQVDDLGAQRLDELVDAEPGVDQKDLPAEPDCLFGLPRDLLDRLDAESDHVDVSGSPVLG